MVFPESMKEEVQEHMGSDQEQNESGKSSPEKQEQKHEEFREALKDVKEKLDSLKSNVESESSLDDEDRKKLHSFVEDLLNIEKNNKQLKDIEKRLEKGQGLEKGDIETVSSVVEGLKDDVDNLKEEEKKIIIDASKRNLFELQQQIDPRKKLKKEILGEAKDASLFGIGLFSAGSMIEDIMNYFEQKYTGEAEKEEGEGGLFSKIGLDFNFDEIWVKMKLGMLSMFAPEIHKKLKKYEQLLSGGSSENNETGGESLSNEEIEKYKEKFSQDMLEDFEKATGNKIDEEKFDKVFESWFDKHFKAGKSLTSKQATKIREAIVKKDKAVNLFDMAMESVIFPFEAMFDLTTRLIEAGIIDWTDLAIQGTMEAGERTLEIGIGSLGIFYNAIQIPLGKMSLEEFQNYVENMDLSANSRMALWGLLYRHGGLIWKTLGQIGNLTGYTISFLFGGEAKNSTSKLKSFFKGGMWDDMDTQLRTIEELENSLLKGTNQNLKLSKNLRGTLGNMKHYTKVYSAAQSAENLDDFKRILSEVGIDDIDSVMKNIDNIGSGLDSSNFKRLTSSYISEGLEQSAKNLHSPISQVEESVSSVLKGQWSESGYYKKISRTIGNHGKVMGRMLDEDRFAHNTKKIFDKFSKGAKNVETLRQAERGALYLKKIENAKEFVEHAKILARESPEVLKTVLGSAPLIAVGAEIITAFENENKGVIESLLEGFAYITPVVGPVWLVRDSLRAFDDKKEIRPGQAAIGGVLLGVDGRFAVSAVRAGGKEFAKFLAQPALEMGRLMRGVAYDAPKMGWKFMRGGYRAGIRGLGREILSSFRSFGIRAGAVAALLLTIYGSYELLIENEDVPEDVKKMAKKLKDSSPEELEHYIEKEWSDFGKKEKSFVLQAAVAQHTGSSIPDVDVNMEESNKVKIKLNTLMNREMINSLEQRFEEKIENLENEKVSVEFGIQKSALRAKAKDFETNSQFRNYLSQMGFEEEVVDEIMKEA